MLKRVFKKPDFICADCGSTMEFSHDRPFGQRQSELATIKCVNTMCLSYNVRVRIEMDQIRGEVKE